MELKELALAALFAALYAILVIVLAPISFGPLQLRVADVLIPLSALFGRPIVIGTAVGCFAANYYFYLGPQDVILGPLANLASSYLIFLLRGRRALACVLGSFVVGFVVGSYLWLFFPPPYPFSYAGPPWLAMSLSITASSLITVGLLGYLLLIALDREDLVNVLRRLGIRVYSERTPQIPER